MDRCHFHGVFMAWVCFFSSSGLERGSRGTSLDGEEKMTGALVVRTEKIICVFFFFLKFYKFKAESSTEDCFCLSRRVHIYGLLQPKRAGRSWCWCEGSSSQMVEA